MRDGGPRIRLYRARADLPPWALSRDPLERGGSTGGAGGTADESVVAL
jgi:hypothetical protein